MIKKFLQLFGFKFNPKLTPEELENIEKNNKAQPHLIELWATKQFESIYELVNLGITITDKNLKYNIADYVSHLFLNPNQIDNNKDFSTFLKILEKDKNLCDYFFREYADESSSWNSYSASPIERSCASLRYQNKFGFSRKKHENINRFHQIFYQSFQVDFNKEDNPVTFSPIQDSNKLFFKLLFEQLDKGAKCSNMGLPVEFIWAYWKEKNGNIPFHSKKEIEKFSNFSKNFYGHNVYSNLFSDPEVQQKLQTFFFNFTEHQLLKVKEFSDVHKDLVDSLKQDKIKNSQSLSDIADILEMPPILNLHLKMLDSQFQYFKEKKTLSPEYLHYVDEQEKVVLSVIDEFNLMKNINNGDDSQSYCEATLELVKNVHSSLNELINKIELSNIEALAQAHKIESKMKR